MKFTFARPATWLFLTLVGFMSGPRPGDAQELMPKAHGEVLSTGTTLTGCGEACGSERPFSARFTPYFWLTQMHGDLTVRGETAAVDVSFSKTLDLIFGDLNFAFLGQVEANFGSCGFLLNGVYMNIAPGGQVRNVDFSADFTQTILDAAFTYELGGVSEMMGWSTGSRLELLAGIRYNALTGGLTLTGPSGNRVSASGSQEWVDPIIGSRIRLPYNDCWTFTARGDIGGFGLGKASQFTWNIELMAEYSWSEHCKLIGGWRWLDINYENGSGSMKFGYDMTLSGPVLGLAIDF